MLITIHSMTMLDGIHGEDSQREALPISLGYGRQEIMKLILYQKL